MDLLYLVPDLMSAFFWSRGLWRGRVNDCVAGCMVASGWTVILTHATGSMRAINALGMLLIFCSVASALISLVVPARPQMTAKDIRLASVCMLVTGFWLTILL